MDLPLSPSKNHVASFKQKLNKLKIPIINLYPQYEQKINALGFHKQLIITSPKSFVNLFESKQLNGQENEERKLEAWSNICELVIEILKIMPINSTFIYKQASFVVHISGSDFGTGYRTVNSVEYIIIKIFEFLQQQSKIKTKIHATDDEEQKMKLNSKEKKIMEIVSKLCVLYHYFMQNCCVHTKTLKLITQILCTKFYSGQLTIKMLQISFNMFSQLNGPSICQTETGNLQPFLYFSGVAKIGLRLLITNNKWPFHKGMHICLWMKSFLQQQSPNNYILYLKVDDKNSFVLKQERNEIAIESLVAGQHNKRIICDIPIRKLVKLQIVLQVKQSGLFKTNTLYRVHVRVNGEQAKNVQIKMPRFDSSDFVTQFNMFGEFIGQFYTLAIWKSINSYAALKDNLPNSLQNEYEVNKFLQTNPDLVQDILTILTPLRVYKGILINMISSEENHACHEATMLLNSTQSKLNKYLTSFSQILLPYLYFTVKIWREIQDPANKKPQSETDEIKFECQKFINTLIQQYCKSRLSYLQQIHKQKLTKIKNNILQNYKLTVLFILYWLENTAYPISQTTLLSLLELTLSSPENFQPLFYKYIDKNTLTDRNYKHSQYVKTLLEKSKNSIQNANQILEPCNPVTKLQILFYLETTWRELWNKYQYMTQWWQPINLKMQSDIPFDYTRYLIINKNKKEEEYQKFNGQNKHVPHPYIQWTVSEFITNDFCDCLIVPIILDPTYQKLGEQLDSQPSPFVFKNFQEEYIKKQCMTEDFVESDFIQTVLNKEESQTYIFKKVARGFFGSLLGYASKNGNQVQINTQKTIKKNLKPNGQQQAKYSRFQTDASYLNLLTLVIGTLAIEVKGKSAYIYFAQKHYQHMLDHMCVKAYKNEEYIYICIDLGDVRVIKRRRFNQSMNGMQIRLKSGHGYLFYFHEKNIDKFIAFLKQSTKNVKNKMDTVFKDPYDQYLKSNQTTLWIDKKISNWEYLQWLNDIAGRSYNDITQYPVLPWIYIQDHNNPQTTLTNSTSFRDLTKNMGSFGPQDRINHFLDKYQNAGQSQIFSFYHFGTHYSSSAIIFNFLIRLRPFSVGAVTLQSGKFDCADRVFSSYIGSWVNATNSPTDIRELIPQIYLLPEMMININGYDFGFTQLKERICNVELPKWCNHNPYIFCKYLRKALESQYVNQKITHWIDLIYGFKQRGQAAVDSMNIFFPLTYQLAINVDKVTDLSQKMSIQTQIAHFGQNPAQIIGSNPHPLKSAIKQKWQSKLLADCNDIIIQKCNLTRMNTGEVKFIYQSVFEDKNSILSIKFMTDNIFLVLRRYQFCLFKILDNKSGFISKEKEIEFITEKDNISLDYQNIATYVPMVTIIHKWKNHEEKNQEEGLTGVSNLAIVGGFYNGTLQIIYLNEVKVSGTMRMPFSTVTALAYSQDYKYLYIGDSQGRLGVYRLSIRNASSSSSKQLQLTQKFHQQVHDLKINSISINKSANLFLTSSQDGSIKLFNLYSQQQYRKIMNPSKYPIVFAKISTCPLYCIIFYSQQNSTVYSYSINGQFLASVEDTTGFIYNMSVLMATDHTECLAYLNAQRQIYIYELPELRVKKKIRLKKDEYKISCFEMTNQIAIAGSQDGALQIIADPSSF